MGCRECYYFPCTKPVCIMGNKEGCDNFMSISSKEIKKIDESFEELCNKVAKKDISKKDISKEYIPETKGNMKIKIFSSMYYMELEDKINEFIKDKNIIDVKISNKISNRENNIIILVMYKEA